MKMDVNRLHTLKTLLLTDDIQVGVEFTLVPVAEHDERLKLRLFGNVMTKHPMVDMISFKVTENE